jgi:hypothetical protein
LDEFSQMNDIIQLMRAQDITIIANGPSEDTADGLVVYQFVITVS